MSDPYVLSPDDLRVVQSLLQAKEILKEVGGPYDMADAIALVNGLSIVNQIGSVAQQLAGVSVLMEQILYRVGHR